MARIIKKTFNAYKEDLKNYKTNITGTIFDTESYGLSGASSVSAVLVRLNDDLTNFFNEKFMIDIDANTTLIKLLVKFYGMMIFYKVIKQ